MTPRHPHRPRWNPFRWVDERAIGSALTKLLVGLIIAAIPAGAVAINGARTQAAEREHGEHARGALRKTVDSLRFEVVAVKREMRRLVRQTPKLRYVTAADFDGPPAPETKPGLIRRALGGLWQAIGGG